MSSWAMAEAHNSAVFVFDDCSWFWFLLPDPDVLILIFLLEVL